MYILAFLNDEVVLVPRRFSIRRRSPLEAAQEPLQPFRWRQGHELPFAPNVGHLHGLKADACVHRNEIKAGSYATFKAFSTFSFSNACFTTSIISVT